MSVSREELGAELAKTQVETRRCATCLSMADKVNANGVIMLEECDLTSQESAEIVSVLERAAARHLARARGATELLPF